MNLLGRLSLPAHHSLRNSLLLRMGGAIAAIALLALLGMAVSGLVAVSTQGSGEAINRAGSLRLLSWKLSSLIQAHTEAGEIVTRELRDTVRQFDLTLDDPAIHAILPASSTDPLHQGYVDIRTQWQQHIRPLSLAATAEHHLPLSGTERVQLLDDTSAFVEQLNGLVKRMEDTTEAKILVMRIVLGVTIVLTVLVVALTVWLIHSQLVQPMGKLLSLATHVGRGDLSARTEHTGEDELGALGRAFNLMAEDLSKLYEDLESRVEQKTAELTRSNRSLELLYHSIARLHGAPPGKAVYTELLRDIESVLDIGHGVICLGEPGGDHGVAVANTMEEGECSPCDSAHCRWCHGTEQTRLSIVNDFHRRLTLPLADAEMQYGVLILDIPLRRQIEPWQVQLLEAMSRHIGVAIGAERRIEQNRRVALLEERAVIARELHDSLAQSLAYMRIQVSRLQRTVGEPDKQAETEQVLRELREGMSGAYRQLRELLTTFRLKMEGQDLASALRQTVEEYSERGGLLIDLALSPGRCVLSPNEEIHVLHVVREALSNVLNHAQASQAWISLSCLPEGEVEVAVEDNGVGIIKQANVHHYGMTIMEERARTVSGHLAVTSRPEGGTRVTLVFRPSSRRAAQNTAPADLSRRPAA